MPDALNVPGKFVTGSTLRHVLTMTSAGTVGLVAVFLVDVVNLFYISLLGHKELAAAVGYAGTLLFFMLSLAIGLSIAVGAMTSRALGSGDRTYARQLSGASLLLMTGTMSEWYSMSALAGATYTGARAVSMIDSPWVRRYST